MNAVVEIFSFTVSLSVQPDDKIVNANIETKHKFRDSPVANELVRKVTELISAELTPESLDAMTLESTIIPGVELDAAAIHNNQ